MKRMKIEKEKIREEKKKEKEGKSKGKITVEKSLKITLKHNLQYSFRVAVFSYFGMLFVPIFGCFILPLMLDGISRKISEMMGYRVVEERIDVLVDKLVPPNPDYVVAFDSILFSPALILVKVFLVLFIVILPAFCRNHGIVGSIAVLSIPSVVTWHYLATLILEKESLGASVRNFNPLLAPLSLLDGIFVFIPALTIGAIFTVALQMIDDEKERIPLKEVLKFASIPLALSFVTSWIQLHLFL